MTVLKILVVEDSPTDAELTLREIRAAGIEHISRIVDTEKDFRLGLSDFRPDIILSDYSMPKFDGISALRITQLEFPDVPFLFVSGTIGEETAVDSLKRGAADYVLKGNLSRLPSAVLSAIDRAKERMALKEAEKKLKASHRLFEIFMEHLPGAAYIKDEQGQYIYANKAKAEAFSLAIKDILAKRDEDLVPDLAEALLSIDKQVLDNKKTVQEVLRRANDQYWLVTRFPLSEMGDGRDHIGGIGIDITEQKRAEADLLIRNHAIEVSPLPVLIVDISQPDMPLIYANNAFETVTGYSRAEILGKNCRFLQGDDTDQAELEKIRAAIAEKRPASALLRNYRKDGSMFLNELYIVPVEEPATGEVRHFIGIQNDVTQIKCYQEELERQANYDSLTGLANRNLLKERLQHAIMQCHRHEQPFTVAFIDIDNFKLINDSLGHSAGDQLLSQFGERLLSCVRESDTVARLGGDEFVALLTDQYEDSNHAVMRRIQTELAKPFNIQGRELIVTSSIGLSSYPTDGDDPEGLLANADVAMYRAKTHGRNNFQFYSKEMNARVGERLSLKNDLWHALENDELLLQYQPQLDLASGRAIGMEALIRWKHPKLGLIPPLDFIPMAEEDGLIVPIGEWVMRTACVQTLELQKAGYPHMRVAVNLSARQLAQPDFVDTVKKVLHETGIDPHCLELEITESMVMQNVEQAIRILNDINNLGVHISLDDFGTGYSSLSWLKRFPIDRLKIDRSFIRDITTDADDAVIAQSIIALAHALRVDVIAEGIETQEHLEFLRQNSCDGGQGYFFSKPVDFDHLVGYLNKSVH